MARAGRIALVAGALAALCAACGVPYSEIKSVPTRDFPKTWDQVASEPASARPSRGPSAVSAQTPLAPAPPQRPVDVLELTDRTLLVGVVTAQTPGRFAVLVTAAGEQHTVPWGRIKAGLPAMPTATVDAGAPPIDAGTAPRSPRHAVVVLKDGTKIEGVLVRQEPGQFVVIDLPDGTERTLTWERISEVNVRAETRGAGP